MPRYVETRTGAFFNFILRTRTKAGRCFDCQGCQGSCLHEPLSRYVPVRGDTYRGIFNFILRTRTKAGNFLVAGMRRYIDRGQILFVAGSGNAIGLWLCHSLVRSVLYAAGRHPELVSGSLGVHGNILPGDAETSSA